MIFKTLTILKSLSLKYIFLTACLLTSVVSFAQAGNKTMKSVYKYYSPEYSITLPDSLLRPYGIDTVIRIPIGEMYYTNFCKNGNNRTDLEFQPVNGMIVRGPVYTYRLFNEKDSSIYFYSNDSLVKSYRAFVPALVKSNRREKINDYDCEMYSFATDTSRMELWFSKTLSYKVTPGLCYKQLGGIVRVNYIKGDEHSELVLESHAEIIDPIDFVPAKKLIPKTRKIHWLFH